MRHMKAVMPTVKSVGVN